MAHPTVYAFSAFVRNIENDPVWINRALCREQSLDWNDSTDDTISMNNMNSMPYRLSVAFGLNYCDFSRLLEFFLSSKRIFINRMAVSSAGPHHVHSLEQIELYYRSVPMDIDSGYLFNIPIVSGIINFAHTQRREKNKRVRTVRCICTAIHAILSMISNYKIFSLLFSPAQLTSACVE